MPIGHKLSSFADELGEFLFALALRWRAALTSSLLIGVGLTAWQLATRQPLSLKTYAWMVLFVGLPVAIFTAWVDQFRAHHKAQDELKALRDRPSPDGILYREYMKQRDLIERMQQSHAALANQQQEVFSKLVASEPRNINIFDKAVFGYQVQQRLTREDRDKDILVCVVPTVRDSYALAADIHDMLGWAQLRAQFIPQGRQYADHLSNRVFQNGVWVLGKNELLEREIVAWLRALGFHTYFDQPADPDMIEIIVADRGEDVFRGAPRAEVNRLLHNPPPLPGGRR